MAFDMSDTDRMILGASSSEIPLQVAQGTQYQRHVVPAPVTTVIPAHEEQAAKLREFIGKKIIAPNLDKFNNMKLRSPRVASKEQWTDFEPGKRIALNVRHLTDQEIIDMGQDLFTAIHAGMSLRSVAQLMMLAYNLKDVTGAPVFGTIPSELKDVPHMMELEEYSDEKTKQLNTPKMITLITPNAGASMIKLVKGYTYLACSYLRLYTKSAENYLRIDNHLRSRFKNFYDFSLPFDNFHPDLDAVKYIKMMFELNEKFKNTFYNILYAGEVVPDGRSLKSFLYMIHVSYTGLHAYTLFVRCMDAFNVTNRVLASTIYTKAFEEEIRVLTVIFNDLESSGNKYQMWKYARVFDPAFLNTLQKKICQTFVLVLATMLSLFAPAGHQDVMQIPQVQNSSVKAKKIAEAFAARAHAIITSTQYTDNSLGIGIGYTRQMKGNKSRDTQPSRR